MKSMECQVAHTGGANLGGWMTEAWATLPCARVGPVPQTPASSQAHPQMDRSQEFGPEQQVSCLTCGSFSPGTGRSP